MKFLFSPGSLVSIKPTPTNSPSPLCSVSLLLLVATFKTMEDFNHDNNRTHQLPRPANSWRTMTAEELNNLFAFDIMDKKYDSSSSDRDTPKNDPAVGCEYDCEPMSRDSDEIAFAFENLSKLYSPTGSMMNKDIEQSFHSSPALDYGLKLLGLKLTSSVISSSSTSSLMSSSLLSNLITPTSSSYGLPLSRKINSKGSFSNLMVRNEGPMDGSWKSQEYRNVNHVQYAFLDNSNIWIEGKKIHARQTFSPKDLMGLPEDPRWRISAMKLLRVICENSLTKEERDFGKRSLIQQAQLFGSNPSNTDDVWKAFQNVLDVRVCTRSRYSGKEKRVDNEILCEAILVLDAIVYLRYCTRTQRNFCHPVISNNPYTWMMLERLKIPKDAPYDLIRWMIDHAEIVLISGDADFGPLVKLCQTLDVTIRVCSWNGGVSSEMKKDPKVLWMELDQHIDSIGFVGSKWGNHVSDIPQHCSLVLSGYLNTGNPTQKDEICDWVNKNPLYYCDLGPNEIALIPIRQSSDPKETDEFIKATKDYWELQSHGKLRVHTWLEYESEKKRKRDTNSNKNDRENAIGIPFSPFAFALLDKNHPSNQYEDSNSAKKHERPKSKKNRVNGSAREDTNSNNNKKGNPDDESFRHTGDTTTTTTHQSTIVNPETENLLELKREIVQTAKRGLIENTDPIARMAFEQLIAEYSGLTGVSNEESANPSGDFARGDIFDREVGADEEGGGNLNENGGNEENPTSIAFSDWGEERLEGGNRPRNPRVCAKQGTTVQNHAGARGEDGGNSLAKWEEEEGLCPEKEKREHVDDSENAVSNPLCTSESQDGNIESSHEDTKGYTPVRYNRRPFGRGACRRPPGIIRCRWRAYCQTPKNCKFGHTHEERKLFQQRVPGTNTKPLKYKLCEHPRCNEYPGARQGCTYAHSREEIFCPTCGSVGQHQMDLCPRRDEPMPKVVDYKKSP